MDYSEQLIGHSDEIQRATTILEYCGLTDSQILHHKLELCKEGMSVTSSEMYIRDNFRRLHGYGLLILFYPYIELRKLHYKSVDNRSRVSILKYYEYVE